MNKYLGLCPLSLTLTLSFCACVCVGFSLLVLLQGDTQHFEYISQSVSSGLMSVGLQTSTPVR